MSASVRLRLSRIFLMSTTHGLAFLRPVSPCAMRSPPQGRESAIENLFQDLVERAIEIFRREEDVLSASSEPNAILHRQGHLAILSVVARMRAEHRDHGGSPDLALRMRAELLDFIREHHALLDAMLGRHVREWSLRTRLEGE